MIALSLFLTLCASVTMQRQEDSASNHPYVPPVFTRQQKHQLSLRFDYTNLKLTSHLARVFQTHQNNCGLPQANFHYRNRFGLGSDLHVWTQALCNAIHEGYRIRTLHPWMYVARNICKNNNNNSAMQCYFPNSEAQCPRDNDASVVVQHKLYRGKGIVSRHCESILKQYNVTYADVRAAGMEYLFSRVSQRIQDDATHQLHQVFSPFNKIPNDLITVHIRWGDKAREMKLLAAADYVAAVQHIVTKRNLSKVTIYVATEDPGAVTAFRTACPSEWTVFVDAYVSDFRQNRNAEYNGNPKMTAALHGLPGFKALGSLLVAMEARDYVLTTKSNWSRLLNELRKSIVDPRCGGCTTMMDLSHGEW
jgi:hypothetical protein